MLKLIKKLKALVAKLQAAAIEKQSRKLMQCAERTDSAHELCIKRVEFAESLRKQLEDRAFEKLESGVNDIEADRKEAAKLLEELKSI